MRLVNAATAAAGVPRMAAATVAVRNAAGTSARAMVSIDQARPDRRAPVARPRRVRRLRSRSRARDRLLRTVPTGHRRVAAASSVRPALEVAKHDRHAVLRRQSIDLVVQDRAQLGSFRGAPAFWASAWPRPRRRDARVPAASSALACFQGGPISDAVQARNPASHSREVAAIRRGGPGPGTWPGRRLRPRAHRRAPGDRRSAPSIRAGPGSSRTPPPRTRNPVATSRSSSSPSVRPTALPASKSWCRCRWMSLVDAVTAILPVGPVNRALGPTDYHCPHRDGSMQVFPKISCNPEPWKKTARLEASSVITRAEPGQERGRAGL